MRSFFLLTVALAATPAAAEEGWIEMFNGSDLSGWKLNEGNGIKAEDGMIVISGERAHLFYTQREFKDFVFEADVKTTPGSNSGIYFHTKYQDEGWPAQGHEIQVNISHTDPVKSGSLYNRVKLFSAPAKDNEWYRCRITVKGKTVRTEINDKVLYEYVEPPGVSEEPQIGDGGLMALQAHDPKSVVYYRDLRIKPLDEAKK
ncbi:MAG: DUF1080 domain-containing protein [Planctomycetota bacterium]|nr:DUF1080 domain-containing protein [Planctomycetaceae bacterium]MDQ3332266.1 DUF1080 domain-containing protein [Planctomycetota bacterium]